MKNLFDSVFRAVILMFAFLISINCFSQSVDILNKKEVAKWYNSGEWLNGCLLKPHKSINQKAFAKEYFGNKTLWDKTFKWLKINDLNNLEPGKYEIDEGNVVATVSEAQAPELESVKWEIHKNFNDLQYIIKGKALMGVIAASKATVAEVYDIRKDVGFYSAEGKLYTTEPGTFFIFTPEDVHRPGIKVEGYDIVKKIIFKIRAVK